VNQSTPYAAGFDMSDREMKVCVLGDGGSVHQETAVPLDRSVLSIYLKGLRDFNPVVALETGTHANWVYDLLLELGFTKVIVADARMLKMIFQSDKKTDRLDARLLARFAQSCPELLHAVRPRGERARQDRRLLSARHISVEARTRLIAHVRGIVKSTGSRLRDCDADNFHELLASLPDSLQEILAPVMEAIEKLTAGIFTYDELIAKRCKNDPIIERLRQVKCIGPITALAFVATIENPMRFRRTRDVASYVGVRPRIDQSGSKDKQLRITKAGDGYLRQLLVMSGQAILRKSSPATDLKRWGQSIAESGGKRGKRRAAVAVARKLSVLLLSLWKSGKDYEPLRKNEAKDQSAIATKPKAARPPKPARKAA
jgi:transposase